MKGKLLVQALNWVLGVWYVAWIVASGLWMIRVRREGSAPPDVRERRHRRLMRIGAWAGVGALALGALLSVAGWARKNRIELVLAGAVYLLTALLFGIWMRHVRSAGQRSPRRKPT